MRTWPYPRCPNEASLGPPRWRALDELPEGLGGCIGLIGCGFGRAGKRSESALPLAAAPRPGAGPPPGRMPEAAVRVVVMAQRPVTVNDILDGHVVLDLESFDRL